MKPRYPTSIGKTLVIKPFLTHYSRKSAYVSNLRWCAQLKFSSKGTINSITKSFFLNLTDQMTISGRWVVNAISLGNTKWCSKSVPRCQSVQSSSNDDLCLFLCESFEMFPSLTKWITLLVILFRALLAVSQYIFAVLAKISKTSLCLYV